MGKERNNKPNQLKNLFKRFAEKIDKKIAEKAKGNKCCCGAAKNNKSCCS